MSRAVCFAIRICVARVLCSWIMILINVMERMIADLLRSRLFAGETELR